MTESLRLPNADGSWVTHRPARPRDWPVPERPFTARRAYAAAHVVADPLGENVPGALAAIDWDATLGFRHQLWRYGFGVAEAMDTAQRGMGLDWAACRELIRRSAAEARAAGGGIAAGVGTDQLTGPATLADVRDAYEEQAAYVAGEGVQVILMASRALAAVATGPDDYHDVYGKLLAQVSEPVIVHWLGPMFDPALRGYWGCDDIDVATESFVSLISDHACKVDGVKVSLLDAGHERRLRQLLPTGVRVYSGDDFHYPELIRGDGVHHSDALLGVFAAIAPAASAALQALERDETDDYDALLNPTVPLARHLFREPTYYYKTGIAFLAWLAGYQPGFTMIGGLHSGRSVVHLARAYRLADELGLFPDPDRAAHRMRSFLTTTGMAR